MTQYITSAELRGYHSGNDSMLQTEADYVIPGEDIAKHDVEERAGEYKDSAKITIHNDGGQYNRIRHGDRLEFFVQVGEGEEATGYGEGGYGEGAYGPSYRRRWTGMVRNYTISGDGADHYTLELTGEDYVYAVLGMRQVYDSFRGRQIIGPDGILNTILAEEAPEIDRTRLQPVSTTADISFAGESLLDAVINLAAQADCLLSSRGTALLCRPAENLQSRFVVQDTDTGLWDLKSNDDSLTNYWRIDGGTAPEVDDVQELIDGYQLVAGETQITQQIEHPKSEVDFVEIWTRRLDLESEQ